MVSLLDLSLGVFRFALDVEHGLLVAGTGFGCNADGWPSGRCKITVSYNTFFMWPNVLVLWNYPQRLEINGSLTHWCLVLRIISKLSILIQIMTSPVRWQRRSDMWMLMARYIFLPLSPSGLEGYCRHGSGGQAGGRAAAKLVEPISL